MKFLLFLPLFVISTKLVFSQSIHIQDSFKLYKIGYRSIITKDSSRRYKPLTSSKDKLHYRPLEIDIWYPASSPESNTLLQYGELINLLEQRSGRFQDDTVYHGLTEELVQYICTNLKINDTAKLTHLKTISYIDADPLNQRFPLILYMCSFNGMSYENVNLFEWLASHGYVVASIASVGRYPGNMSTNPADLAEQVKDGLFVIDYLKYGRNIDSTKIGVVGYSWGGLAALDLALNNNTIKAILSMDGSEMHYYGELEEEDKDFDRQRSASLFQLYKIKAPYAYLESGFKQTDRQADSIYNPLFFMSTQKLYRHFPRATHEDFSCLPSLVAQISEAKDASFRSYGFVDQWVLNYFDLQLKNKNQLFAEPLSAIYLGKGADSAYPSVRSMEKWNELVIRGRIKDKKRKVPLCYVNVGIPDKNIGTVTGQDGNFLIRLGQDLKDDSIKISMAGYNSRTLSISYLLSQKKAIDIFLIEKVVELKEVVVTAKAIKAEKMGNTTTSRFISIGLPLKFLGSETGIKISLGKNPVLLKTFAFNISDNRLDTAVFRMNIYSFKNGAPFENILQQNIFIPVGKRTGQYTINLTDYKLVFKADILVSLEWIEGSYSGPAKGAIYLSAAFLNSSTWHRLTSQGKWKKAWGLGVGYNLVVQRLASKHTQF